jgi:hypothetical protein
MTVTKESLKDIASWFGRQAKGLHSEASRLSTHHRTALTCEDSLLSDDLGGTHPRAQFQTNGTPTEL